MFALLLRSLPRFVERAFPPPKAVDVRVAYFSKYISKARTKRLPLTTKRVGKGYYKGNRCRKEGRLTSIGNRILLTQVVIESEFHLH
jgi:hypothetical protein